MFGPTRLAGLCVFAMHAMLPVVVGASSFAGDYFLGSARASELVSVKVCVLPCVGADCSSDPYVWYLTGSHFRGIRATQPCCAYSFSVAGSVLTNFLTTGEYACLSRLTVRGHASQALSVLMAVVCCTFASAGLICMGLPFHDEHPPWRGGHCLSDHQGVVVCRLLLFAGFRWQTASDSKGSDVELARSSLSTSISHCFFFKTVLLCKSLCLA